MRLGLRMLNSSSTLNTLLYVNQVNINPGETAVVMFQLVDLDSVDNFYQYQQKVYNRYMPAPSSLMTLALNSINVSNNLTKVPFQPFAQDPSIWAFNMSSYDTSVGAGVNMTVTLTETSKVSIATINAAILFGPKSNYSC